MGAMKMNTETVWKIESDKGIPRPDIRVIFLECNLIRISSEFLDRFYLIALHTNSQPALLIGIPESTPSRELYPRHECTGAFSVSSP